MARFRPGKPLGPGAAPDFCYPLSDVALVNTITPIGADRVVVSDMDGRVMLVERQ